MAYHDFQDGKDEILNRERVNLPALYFSLVYHLGLKLNLVAMPDAEADNERKGCAVGPTNMPR